MAVSSGKQRALYERIADDLRDEIASGRLRPGERLPTEGEIAEAWKTSRITAARGLKVLVHQGLIYSQRPLGYFVKDTKRVVYRPQQEFREPAPEVDIFRQRIADEGDGRETSQHIEVSIIPVPELVRSRLQIGSEESVAVRRRTRSIGGNPYSIQDSYVRLSLVEGSAWMSPKDVARGTNRVLAELGYGLVRALDEITVRMPTPEEAARLFLGPGTPVAEHLVTAYSDSGDPVQVTANILPGDRHVIIYERVKPEGIYREDKD
jgi:GntR family transcriptional regulator